MQHLVLSMAKKTKEKQILSILLQAGALRARDAEDHHIPRAILSRMVSSGQLRRSSRGVYTLPEGAVSEHRALVDVAIRIPSAVICLLTALRHYQIGTQSPSEVWVALPATQPPPRLDYPRVRYVWMSPSSHSAGVDVATLDGTNVKIFSPAKTVVDCFKYRNKLGTDVAVEALADAWKRNLVSIADLWHFAKIDRVSTVMRPYLESLTA